MSQLIIYGSDNRLTLSGLRNVKTGALIADAAVTATLTTRDGQALPGTWPLVLAAVSGAPGSYDGILPLELALVADQFYTVRVYVNGGPGLRRRFEDVAQVKRG